MNEKPSRLGRGLAALIGDMTPIEGARLAEGSGGKRLPVEFIIANRANPRRDFDPDQLEELTSSIRENAPRCSHGRCSQSSAFSQTRGSAARTSRR